MHGRTSAGGWTRPRSVASGLETPLSEAERRRIEARFAAIPLARTLGVRMTRLERGECALELADRRDLDGIFESLHGGILATLADSRCATLYGARYLGLDTEIGSLEPGKLADFVVLDANPLEDLRNAENIRWVVVYEGERLDEVANHPRPRAPFF